MSKEQTLDLLKQSGEKITDYIKSALDKEQNAPQILRDAMFYSVGAGGKRIRPYLCLEFYRILGKNPDDIINFAAAVEMIHTYSLIHDDLPCMDNDDMRRGKPSCHKAFDEATALLAGDALLTFAFQTASEISPNISPERALAAVNALATAAGLCNMVGGQVIDLQSENKQIGLEELERLQYGKTVAMLKVNAQIACILGGADENQTYHAVEYCECVGKAFQIRDDILDVVGDEKTFGKPIGSDSENHKNTFVTLLGLEKSKQICGELTQKAVDALSIFNEADNLKNLAYILCDRDK